MSTTARDLMEKNVVTIPAAMPLAEIRHLFVTAGIYGAPVVDEGGNVVGIVSAIDLLRAEDQALDDDLDAGEPTPRDLTGDGFAAAELASPDVVWVAPDTPVAEIAQLMRDQHIHRVLVGDGTRLEGILTSFDLLRAIQA